MNATVPSPMNAISAPYPGDLVGVGHCCRDFGWGSAVKDIEQCSAGGCWMTASLVTLYSSGLILSFFNKNTSNNTKRYQFFS
jgi:hypothetical protein